VSVARSIITTSFTLSRNGLLALSTSRDAIMASNLFSVYQHEMRAAISSLSYRKSCALRRAESDRIVAVGGIPATTFFDIDAL